MQIRNKNGFTPFETQLSDLKLICQNAFYANFSEMGAGKSWPQAQLSVGVIEDSICDYALIVTPKVVLGDWLDIFKEQIDCDWRNLVTVYHAPANIRPHFKLRPIVIMTYETFVADYARFKALQDVGARFMVTFDEAHKLKNPGNRTRPTKKKPNGFSGSMRTALATEFSRRCRRCYLLTGSPITNGAKNAYTYLDILRPDQFYTSFKQFELTHMVYSPYDRRILIGYRGLETIQKALATCSVRHLKKEVLELPPVQFLTRHLDWGPKQLKIYKELRETGLIELSDRFIEPAGAGALIIRCHQILTNPYQLGIDCECTRWDVLDDDLEEIGIDQEKVVIYAYYRDTIQRLNKKLAKYNPAVIYGGTSDVEAEKAKFKSDESCRVMIANPKSAGIGTNFTVARYIIFFEYAYDLDDYDQAVSRCNRPGQRDVLTVLNYAVRGSMEQTKILPKLVYKKEISMTLLSDRRELIEFLSVDESDLNF